MKERKFECGQLVLTAAVEECAKENPAFNAFVSVCFLRHMTGDWGDLEPEDAKMNDEALSNDKGRLFSAYIYPPYEEIRIWIITEEDRSVTTILFPSDY